MVRHMITKYVEGGVLYAEAWVQVDLLGRCWCLSRRRIEVGEGSPEGEPSPTGRSGASTCGRSR